MRSLTLLFAATLLVLGGCYRTDVSKGPDRKGHALVIDSGASGQVSGSSASQADSGVQAGPPRAGETVITLGADEPLWAVAEQYQVDLAWLIRRNDLTRRPGPGDRIIVPDRGIGK